MCVCVCVQLLITQEFPQKRLPLHHFATAPVCHCTSLALHQFATAPFCHCTSLPLHQLGTASVCHCTSLALHQFATAPFCHCTSLPLHLFGTAPVWHSTSLALHQFGTAPVYCTGTRQSFLPKVNKRHENATTASCAGGVFLCRSRRCVYRALVFTGGNGKGSSMIGCTCS